MAEERTVKMDLFLIGGSAGSLDAILQLLPFLPNEKSFAIVLVVHRRGGESVLSGLLHGRTSWLVKEAEEKENIVPGTLYIAPADYHLLIEKAKSFSLDYSEKINFSRPSIDVTFETAADAYGPAVVALLVSGANGDGTEGLKKIKAAGGYVLVQDPAEAPVSYMPKHAIDHVLVDEVLSMQAVPTVLQRFNNIA